MATPEAVRYGATEARPATGIEAVPVLGQLYYAWNFMRRWPVIPVAVIVALFTMAIFAPLIAPFDPNDQNLRSTFARPFWYTEYYNEDPVGKNIEKRHILGADEFGRDVFSRFVFGARVSLMVAIVSMVSGVILGAWAGIARSRWPLSAIGCLSASIPRRTYHCVASNPSLPNVGSSSVMVRFGTLSIAKA